MASPTTTTTTTVAPAAGKTEGKVPLEHLEQAIGQKVWIILKSDKEIEGTLLGFDELVNMIVENVVELSVDVNTGTSKEVGRVDEILLNGNNVVMIAIGGRPR